MWLPNSILAIAEHGLRDQGVADRTIRCLSEPERLNATGVCKSSAGRKDPANHQKQVLATVLGREVEGRFV